MSHYNRRLPVYLLLDCSESMAGDAFNALKQGLSTMLIALRNDPMALETAYISIITFAGKARQLVPLTEVLKFDTHHLPKLKLGSGTALGEALTLFEDCLKREVVKSTAETKGDYKPICFILTDGEPTDKWESAADRIHNTVCGKQANVIGVACGPEADLAKLRRVTDVVIAMKEPDAAAFAKFFKWVSASVSTASQALERGGDKGVGLPDLPGDVVLVSKKHAEETKPAANRYFFLPSRCTRNQKLYLLRFLQEQKSSGFFGLGKSMICKGVAAHPLDDFDFDSHGGGQGQKVQSDALQEPAPCPYCSSPLLAACVNGHFHCAPASAQGVIRLTCPWCQTPGDYGFGGAFGVDGGAG